MSVVARLNYLRIAPRKVRLVADLIRGKKVEEAQTVLNFAVKKATKPLLKLLKTAIIDAHHNFQLEPNNLYISKITVDEGPKYKRWMPRARGSAYEIQKKTSHITLVLAEIEKKPKRIKKRGKQEIKKKPVPSKAKEVKQGGKEEAKKAEMEKPPKEPAKAGPTGQARLRPEAGALRPKTERGIKRIFRRKAF